MFLVRLRIHDKTHDIIFFLFRVNAQINWELILNTLEWKIIISFCKNMSLNSQEEKKDYTLIDIKFYYLNKI